MHTGRYGSQVVGEDNAVRGGRCDAFKAGLVAVEVGAGDAALGKLEEDIPAPVGSPIPPGLLTLSK